MEIYVVGGFIRDTLMGLSPKDKDYVVVGSSVEEMESLGYTRVGKSFPVMLHPQTGEEYALARKEKRIDDKLSSYDNFKFTINNVSIEEDLYRRDLTINSMAVSISDIEEFEKKPTKSHIIDPNGGYDDLMSRVFRHTSEAFCEDPVRVLRLAKFNSRYGNRNYPHAHDNGPINGFKIHDDTVSLIKGMDLSRLINERVRKELVQSLMEKYPSHFFRALLEVDQLSTVFPLIHDYTRTIENPDHHAEGSDADHRIGIHKLENSKMGNSFEHVMIVLDVLPKICNQLSLPYDVDDMLGALTHDLGKTITPLYVGDKAMAIEGRHHDHEKKHDLIDLFCDPLNFGNTLKKKLKLIMRHHMKAHLLPLNNGNDELKAVKIVRMMDSLQTKDTVNSLIKVSSADHNGRLNSYPEVEHIQLMSEYFQIFKSITLNSLYTEEEILSAVKSGKIDNLKNRLEFERTKLLKSFIKDRKNE